MATYKTRADLEKAGNGAELRAALKAAQGKVVTLKRVHLASGYVYVTGDLDKALVDDVTGHGQNKHAIAEFSLGVSGSTAYITKLDAKSFMDACRKAGVRISSVNIVDDVAAALRAGSAG